MFIANILSTKEQTESDQRMSFAMKEFLGQAPQEEPFSPDAAIAALRG
jgi:hypothetical protein